MCAQVLASLFVGAPEFRALLNSGLLLHARGTQACLPSLVQGQVRAIVSPHPRLPPLP